MTASAAEVEAAQKAMDGHWFNMTTGGRHHCSCGWSGSDFSEHRFHAVADAVVAAARPRIAAETLREAAEALDATRSTKGIGSRALDPGRAYAIALLRDRADGRHA